MASETSVTYATTHTHTLVGSGNTYVHSNLHRDTPRHQVVYSVNPYFNNEITAKQKSKRSSRAGNGTVKVKHSGKKEKEARDTRTRERRETIQM